MLEKIATYVVPVVSIALTYVLGRLQASHTDKRAAYKEAYETFYLPFISALYKTQIWYKGFSQLGHNDQASLFRMVTENIQYMDQSILKYIDVLYGHYDAVRYDKGFEGRNILTPARLDEVFDALTERVLSRSTWLANKLHQPELGQFVRELYLGSQASRETQPRTTE